MKKGDFRPTMEHESGFPTEFAVLPLLTKVSQSDLSSRGELFGSLVNLYLFPSFLVLQKNQQIDLHFIGIGFAIQEKRNQSPTRRRRSFVTFRSQL